MTNPERITSSQNARLKEVLRLRKRRHRDRRQSILIDGSREVCRAIEAGVDIQELYVTDAFWQGTETAGWRTSLDSNVRVSLDDSTGGDHGALLDDSTVHHNGPHANSSAVLNSARVQDSTVANCDLVANVGAARSCRSGIRDANNSAVLDVGLGTDCNFVQVA